jgi:hypothetical protein
VTTYTTARTQTEWRSLARHSTLRVDNWVTRDCEHQPIRTLFIKSGTFTFVVFDTGEVAASHLGERVAFGQDAEVLLENAIADASAIALGGDS